MVTPDLPRNQLSYNNMIESSQRINNFVFYAGDKRPHAVEWAGCNRTKMLLPLENRSNMDVRIVSRNNRLTQDEYNKRTHSSEYCLIVCGDTPTSRSLTSAMVHGCIPIRIGARLRGFCEPPCHPGWGWKVTHLSHLPFDNQIDWALFPEVDEESFTDDPVTVLEDLLRSTDSKRKAEIRAVMNRTQMAWVYGWGNPVTSTDFGQAVEYVWGSLLEYLIAKDG